HLACPRERRGLAGDKAARYARAWVESLRVSKGQSFDLICNAASSMAPGPLFNKRVLSYCHHQAVLDERRQRSEVAEAQRTRQKITTDKRSLLDSVNRATEVRNLPHVESAPPARGQAVSLCPPRTSTAFHCCGESFGLRPGTWTFSFALIPPSTGSEFHLRTM
ncbi:hypothetical protein EV126DRAFT_481694, partial [Verticillium dahliae]